MSAPGNQSAFLNASVLNNCCYQDTRSFEIARDASVSRVMPQPSTAARMTGIATQVLVHRPADNQSPAASRFGDVHTIYDFTASGSLAITLISNWNPDSRCRWIRRFAPIFGSHVPGSLEVLVRVHHEHRYIDHIAEAATGFGKDGIKVPEGQAHFQSVLLMLVIPAR